MKTVFVDANVLFSAAHRPAWTIGRLLVGRTIGGVKIISPSDLAKTI